MTSKIEWTDETWNPVTGCTKVSAGCAHCYAERMARRLAGRCGYPEAPDHFKVTLHPKRLDQPLHWKKPRMVFVCSMGDLFHEDVPDEYIDRVWSKFYECPQHTFQVLTKRPERMYQWLVNELHNWRPLPNVWLGVTAENQTTADERIPVLLQIPAAVRFVSIEPMLGPVDLRSIHQRVDSVNYYIDALSGNVVWLEQRDIGSEPMGEQSQALDWVIVGGESGPGAQPMDPDWARSIRDQCQAAGVPFFFKQWGAWVKFSSMPGYNWTQVVFMDEQGKEIDPQNGCAFYRVGKKAAGRLLDGREWNEMPEVKHWRH